MAHVPGDALTANELPNPWQAEPSGELPPFPQSPLGRMAWAWTPAIAVMAGIFVVSGIEDLAAPPGGISDKLGHFLAYGGLALCMLRAVTGARLSRVSWTRAGLAWMATAAYGASDEVHQMFVRGRFAAVDDWIADAAGAAVALAIVTTAITGAGETRKV